MDGSTPESVERSVRWRERDVDAETLAALAETLAISRPLARVLAGRGVGTREQGESFLAPSLKALPDPGALAGVDAAVDRVVRAVLKGEHIGIFGDYDVDGVTSTTLLWDFLERLGARETATIPDRLLEGYGLSRAGVDRLADAGCTLVVTVDCGVTAHEEVEYACQRGIDVVVIDHHTVPVTLPRAVSVMNPHRLDCLRGSEALCAVGVTFNLCLAVRRHLRERGFFTALRPEPDLRDALDLVALGTVADVVPLIGENRILVTQGLKVLRLGRRVGVLALLEAAQVELGRVDASTLGFQLGPRVNAAGRLGDAMQAVRLLRSKEPGEARNLAMTLNEENIARRDLERRIVEDAISQIQASTLLRSAKVLVVGDESWHPGVVGIVASRIVEKFGKPAIVVGEGGRGSGRSIERFHLHEALTAVSSTLSGFGGHAHAAGVRVPPGGLDAFRDAIINHGEQVLAPEDLHRVVVHDGALALEDINENLCAELKRAAPCGRKNPEPVFCFRGVTPTGVRTLSGGHVKATVAAGRQIEAIAFGVGERAALFGGPLDILATPEINEWRGSQTVQLRVRDFVPAGQPR
jgi:single-stranded-DNA-specific exonuclease